MVSDAQDFKALGEKLILANGIVSQSAFMQVFCVFGQSICSLINVIQVRQFHKIKS